MMLLQSEVPGKEGESHKFILIQPLKYFDEVQETA